MFKAKGINQDKLNSWLDEDTDHRSQHGPSHDDVRNIVVRRRHVRKALKLSNNSAPGPDGIPYGAWRAMGKTAVDALFDAMKDFMSSDGEELLRRDYSDFNASLSFFLPKKAIGKTRDGGACLRAWWNSPA